MKKRRVGILGATGMVGQRFATLLAEHPWFDVVVLAASPRSRGKTYQEAVKKRWALDTVVPSPLKNMTLYAVREDFDYIANEVDIVFCALDLDKETIKGVEERYAAAGVAVISNNSAHRWTEDVPMIIPEVNPQHAALIDVQRKHRGWKRGLVAVKPNCSIQSYVAILTALQKFEPEQVSVTSLQAISGAGKTFESWPEMADNVIPYISGEEEKSEREPLKIWGQFKDGKIHEAHVPNIATTCIRVPVSDGHLADVTVRFAKKPTKTQLLAAVKNYQNLISDLNLPSSPKTFIKYFDENDRPQTKLDRGYESGMGIAMGRLRETPVGWRFIALSHNTVRGAAGGAVLTAELLAAKGYLR